MAVGRDMVWARYTDDRGAFHSVRINRANVDLAGSGFAAWNATDPYLPARYMRKVRGNDPASGDTQEVYAGTKTAAIFMTDTTFDYPRIGNVDPVTGDPVPVTYEIIGTPGETLPRPRTIRNI